MSSIFYRKQRTKLLLSTGDYTSIGERFELQGTSLHCHVEKLANFFDKLFVVAQQLFLFSWYCDFKQLAGLPAFEKQHTFGGNGGRGRLLTR